METEIKRVEWILFGTPESEGTYSIIGVGNVFIPQEAIDTVARQGPPYFGVEITPEPTDRLTDQPISDSLSELTCTQAQWRVTKLVYDAFDPQ